MYQNYNVEKFHNKQLEDKEKEESQALHLAGFLCISSSILFIGRKPAVAIDYPIVSFSLFLPINVVLQELSTCWFSTGFLPFSTTGFLP